MGISLWGHKVSLLGSLLCFAFVFPFCFLFQWLKFPLPVVVLCDYEGTMCRRRRMSCGESIECEICKISQNFPRPLLSRCWPSGIDSHVR